MCKRNAYKQKPQDYWIFRFSLLTFHFRKMHYVAIVPADLRSAGIEYKDLQSDYFLFCFQVVKVVRGVIANKLARSQNQKLCGFLSQELRWQLDFSFFTFHFRKTHYVAIVPADLRSAGIEYKDLFNPITSYFVSRQLKQLQKLSLTELARSQSHILTQCLR